MIWLLPIALGGVVLVLFAGYEFGRAEAHAYYEPIIDNLQDTIEALLPPRVSLMVEDIEPGSREDLFNRADPGCELCEGAGHVGPVSGPVPCPCTEVDQLQ